ncbi:MAG: Baseplate wedge protein gp25 [Pseudomonadota bacterium]|jgi:type VI secretion system lysozyme-like protein
MKNRRPSLLDRFLPAAAPTASPAWDPGWTGGAPEEDLTGLRRDLMDLLAARNPWPVDTAPGGLIDSSILVFGLPDTQMHDIDSLRGRAAIRAGIAEAIRRFEPRLTDVTVEDPVPGDDGRMTFPVHARLTGAAQTRTVVIQASLDRTRHWISLDCE